MIVIAPPNHTDFTDSDSSVQPNPGEALIEEARQRAQTRRRRYRRISILASIATAGALVVTLTVMGSGGSPIEEHVADSPWAAGAPVAEPPVRDATLVASWGVIHSGWVLVYDDGLVLRYPDSGAWVAEGMSSYAIAERRLTPAGLELIQSGALPISQLNVALIPADAWAEANWRPYVPAEYAVCHWDQSAGQWTAASELLAELPPVAQTLLRDRQREFRAFSFHPAFTPPDILAPAECFALTTDQADHLVRVSYRPDFRRYRAEGTILQFVGERGVVEMLITPVMPHGEFVEWGG